MLQIDKILLETLLLVILSASAVVSIFDPNYTEKTKSYHLDPYIARELQRTHHHHNHEGILSQSNPRLSSSVGRYHQAIGSSSSSNIEQQERHANPDRNDYANNLDKYYDGCPSGYTGLLPYPYDCMSFVNCWNGRPHIQNCAPGTFFNGDTLECDNPSKVVCKGLNAKAFDQQPTNNNRLGRLQQYNGNGGDDEVVSCPTGHTGLLPHPRDCAKFLNCASGIMHIQTCGPQTVFNPLMKVCDFPSKVDCTGRGEAGSAPVAWSGNRDGKNFETTSTRNQLTPSTQVKGWPHNHNHHHHHHHEHGFHHGFHGHDYPSSSTIKGGSFAHHNHNCTDRSHNHHHPLPQTTPLFNRNRWTSMNRTRPAAPTTRTPTVPSTSWIPMPSRQPSSWKPVSQEPIPANRPTWLNRGEVSTTPSTVPNIWTGQPSNWRPISQEPVSSNQPTWSNPGNSGYQPSTTTTTPSPSNYPNVFYGSTPSTPGTDTTIYYAQPVDDDQPSEEDLPLAGADITEIRLPANRRNYSRSQPSDPTMDTINIPNINLMPPHRTSPSDDGQFQSPESYQPTPPSSRDAVFTSGSYQPGLNNPSSQSPDDGSMDSINIPNLNLMPPYNSPSNGDDGQFQIPEQFPSIQPQPTPSQPPNFGRVPVYDINVRNNFPVEETTPRSEDTYPDYSSQYPSFTLPNSKPQSRDSTLQPSSGSDHPSWLKPQVPQSSYNPSPGNTQDTTFETSSGSDQPSWLRPQPPQSSYNPNPGSTDTINPTPASRQNPWIRMDESNLFGGMLPPPPPGGDPKPNFLTTTPRPLITTTPSLKTNVRVFQIYSPPGVQNATAKIHPNPFYSPSYSGVAHSRNTTWPSIRTSSSGRSTPPPSSWGSLPTLSRGSTPPPSRSSPPPTLPTSENSYEPDIVFSHDGGVVIASHHQTPPSTTQHHGLSPPSYNREFYKPTTPMSVNQAAPLETDSDDDQISQMPISEAIKLLLRPYINRSGTVTDDMVSKAESHIMNLATSPDQTPTPTTTTSTTTTPEVIPTDVEIVFAGEQNSLSLTYVPPPPLPSSPSPSSKYHERHNRHFHQNHPHLPNPFGNELGDGDNNGDVTDDSSTVSSTPRPEETSPEVDNRLGSDLCEFDCGNGQCVKTFETCDGINNCGNRRDEEQCSHLGYEIRLSNEGYGRVEVKILGQWGYVCDDKFGMQDANVVCHELGFKLGASEVHGNSFYPPAEAGEISFVMDEVDCLGNETSLKDCRFMGWGVSDCGPDEVVGVQCKTPAMTCTNDYWLCSTSKECIPPAFVCDNVPDCSDKSDESTAVCNSTVEFRLRGGNVKHEGRLEVRYHGVWGTICDDDFGPTEAQVACNSLGFYGPAKIAKNAFGPGAGPIWLDQVSCYGNETALDKCNHWSWNEHNCNHTEDVSLKCTPGEAPRPTNTKTSSSSEEDLQTTDIYDIGLDLYPMERSSKSAKSRKNICGHFNANLTDEIPRELERVIKGNIAKRGHHPWQATIRTKGRGGMSSHWCGAVLISKKHLLTAAHCLVGYPKGAYFIRLGDHYANIAESSEIDSYIENWYIHEKFREGTHMNNDIAVIVMKNPVRFNDYIQPICLPQEGIEYKEGRRCTISGWGSIQSGVSTPSNNLRVAEIPVISDEICKLPHVYGRSVTEGMFCAGFLDEGVDACEGDSGGPFVCSDSDSETLYGIISWGQQCGHANKPGVYVKVEKYLDWIYEKIRFSMQKVD